MKIKLATALLVGVLLATVGTVIALSRSGQRGERRAGAWEEDEGTLAWHARRAKARGEREVVVPAGRWRFAKFSSLENALDRFTVVVAKPMDSVSRVRSPYAIETWYKFKVREYLNRREWPTCQTCPPPPDAPAELLPLEEDEILISRASGTVIVDGVKITSVENNYPPFSKSQEYLLFVKLDHNHKVGEITVSHYGVFTVNEQGAIRRVNKMNHPLADMIEAHDGDGNALRRLKEKIGARQR